MISTAVTTRILDGFSDAGFGPDAWMALLQASESHGVHLTPQWQREWWNAFGHGRLLLVLAEREGEPVALAPLFSDGGMVFNICPEGSLDFVGDISDPDVLDALLQAARDETPGFAGCRLHFIPDESSTGRRLQEAAHRFGWACHEEGALACSRIELAGQPDWASACTRKKSLLRHERGFLRNGYLEIDHLRSAGEILPQLDLFFDQHRARRASTRSPSLFEDPRQQEYYRSLARSLAPENWIRFTRVAWNGRPVAFHFGLSYRGRFLWGIPSFDIELARKSPGEVLLRHTLLASIDEGATTFDFGIGAEPYKARFATHTSHLRTWGLYPAHRPSIDGGVS